MIGLAKIIPGVSGAVLAISLGVYERILNIASNIRKIKLDDLKFLFFLMLGACLGIGLLCNGVKWCLNYCYFPTMLLFIGMIIGGFPEITSEIKGKRIKFYHIVIFLLSFGILLFITNLSSGNSDNEANAFILGIIEAFTTIIPGISGTAIFMSLGFYDDLLDIFIQLTNFNIDFFTVIMFATGTIISVLFLAKFITFLFNHVKVGTYCAILGFMTSSIFLMFKDLFININGISYFFIGFIFLILGIIITLKINKFFSKF